MKTRESVCKYYVCEGTCEKGRDGTFHSACQHCTKYEPRDKEKRLNKKKQKLDKIKAHEWKEEL